MLVWWSLFCLLVIFGEGNADSFLNYWVYNAATPDLFKNFTIAIPPNARALNPTQNEKFRSHADHMDVYLLEFFNDKSRGCFVDIGAAQWSDPSTTYVVETFNRWSGICYTYSESYVKNLLSNRKCKVYLENSEPLLRNESIRNVLCHAASPRVVDFLSIAKHPDPKWLDIHTLQALEMTRYTFTVVYIAAPTANGYHFLKNHGYRLLHDMGSYGCYFVHQSKADYMELLVKYRSANPPAWLMSDISLANKTATNATFVESNRHNILTSGVNVRALPQVLQYTSLYVTGAEERTVFVFSLTDMRSRCLGNMIGLLFEAIGCAEASDADLFWTLPTNSTFTTASETNRFFALWPTYLENPNNELEATASHVKAKRQCKCFYYCWEYTYAAWVHAHTYLAQLWHRTMVAYVDDVVQRAVQSGAGATSAADLLPLSFFDVNMSSVPSVLTAPSDGSGDGSAAVAARRFPLVPDVALHLRCSDIITNKRLGQDKIHTHYGFLNFHEYAARIPSTARTVYVLSDPPDRGDDGKLCEGILTAFVRFLRERVDENTPILVKRGGEIMYAQAQITLAAVTVCSASTFCFWPALGSQGTTYYPVTMLIYGGKELPLSPGFRWMSDARLHHFSPTDSLQKIVAELSSESAGGHR